MIIYFSKNVDYRIFNIHTVCIFAFFFSSDNSFECWNISPWDHAPPTHACFTFQWTVHCPRLEGQPWLCSIQSARRWLQNREHGWKSNSAVNSQSLSVSNILLPRRTTRTMVTVQQLLTCNWSNLLIIYAAAGSRLVCRHSDNLSPMIPIMSSAVRVSSHRYDSYIFNIPIFFLCRCECRSQRPVLFRRRTRVRVCPSSQLRFLWGQQSYGCQLHDIVCDRGCGVCET